MKQSLENIVEIQLSMAAVLTSSASLAIIKARQFQIRVEIATGPKGNVSKLGTTSNKFKSVFNSRRPPFDVPAKDLYVSVRHIKLLKYCFPMRHIQKHSRNNFVRFRALFYAKILRFLDQNCFICYNIIVTNA